MITEKEIATLTVDGVEVSAIRLGTKDGGLPAHLFQNEKYDGIIITDEGIKDWTWTNIYYEGVDRYVYFPKMELHSLEDIATSKRSDALTIVRKIAKGLESADSEFLNLETGIFPLYRIFIVGKNDVLLLPPDIGDVIALLRSPDERRDEVNVLIRKEAEPSFLLITEMAELLFYAATGALPYIDEEVRHWKYKEYPLEDTLSTFGETLDMKTLGFINFIIHAKNRNMRDIAGNRTSSKALSWFNTNSTGLEWNLGDRDSVPNTKETPEYKAWREKTEKGAKRKNFWRKKGTIITITSIVVIILGAFITEWVVKMMAPPLTKDCTQEEIVMAIYKGQNELDPELLQTALKRVTLPQEQEVVNLYVSTKMRGAYEGMYNPVKNPHEWIEAGRPTLEQGDIIYGVDDITLERIDDNTIIAHSHFYGPWYGDPESNNEALVESPETIPIQISDVTQSFVFEWNKRGWWNVVYSDITTFEPIEILDVDVTPKFPIN